MKMRLKASLGVAVAAGALLVGATSPASASVHMDFVFIQSGHDAYGLYNNYNSYELRSTLTQKPTSPSINTWSIISVAPDTGYPNVVIRNSATNRCMRAMSSSSVQMKSCNSSDPNEIWAMTNSPVGTQFFNFAVRSCLDEGNGGSPYLFHEEGCNSGNPYQGWILR
ncbi:ricin-type beta-trefoil lectin domain protein [Streptomyces sp. NBC_00083]|uniref:ricin-type beta-trefoil lectin domain protein n=1 Tax=Streptomyces sp. NBC_00083 TaxID=2975647 RepID=UPI00224E4EB2|nr:ricin-type beta-trefoil lectin domain protein [Streptomyces sp. NBC_00083]MCX5387402.1 RICIN domain-containing protein [Streptomyces sp. NBC_00083]